MQKITPFLWFDDNAEEAVKFYTAAFKNSKIKGTTLYNEASASAAGKPEGSVMTVSFELAGLPFAAINGGPVFKFTPAISFWVNCETESEINKLWEKLSENKKEVFWDLKKYPFSERYGWLTDKFGISWQLILSHSEQKISPFLSFFGDVFGKAEEAIKYYVSVFKNSGIHSIVPYDKGEEKVEGTIKHASFYLKGQDFYAMESSKDLPFTFNEAISFVVNCKDQEELDYFWDKLSEGGDPNAQQCGWLKDKYGLSWQIVPENLSELLSKDAETSKRVMKSILQMKKIDISKLQEQHELQH